MCAMDFCECARRSLGTMFTSIAINEGSDTGGPSWFVAIPTQWLRLWPLQYAPTAKQNVHARCRARGFHSVLCVQRSDRQAAPVIRVHDARDGCRLERRGSYLVPRFHTRSPTPTAAAPRFHAGQPSASTCRERVQMDTSSDFTHKAIVKYGGPSAIDENPCSKTKRGVYLTCC